MLCPYPREKQLKKSSGNYSDFVVFPCGQCIFCRINKQRELEVRLMLEYMSWDKSAWLTLTYRDEDLPVDGKVTHAHIIKFRTRLRDELVAREAGALGLTIREYKKRQASKDLPCPACKTRLFFAPEYGSIGERPHYHGLVFGLDGNDYKNYSQRLTNKNPSVVASVLAELKTAQDDWAILHRSWPFGFSTIGAVKEGGIRYVIKYCTKGIYHEPQKEEENNLVENIPWTVRSPGLGSTGLAAIASANTRNGIVTGTLQLTKEVAIPYTYRDRISGVSKSGVRKLPLGRYLRDRLAEMLGISEANSLDKAINHQISVRSFHGHWETNGPEMGSKREKVLAINKKKEKKTKI